MKRLLAMIVAGFLFAIGVLMVFGTSLCGILGRDPVVQARKAELREQPMRKALQRYDRGVVQDPMKGSR